MLNEEIIAAEEYAAEETTKDCIAMGIQEFDDRGFRTPMANRVYEQYYRCRLFPIVNIGGISVNTVGTSLGENKSDG